VSLIEKLANYLTSLREDFFTDIFLFHRQTTDFHFNEVPAVHQIVPAEIIKHWLDFGPTHFSYRYFGQYFFRFFRRSQKN
jgi:hypothetical protein